MRASGSSVGPRGATLLLVTAVVGAGLGVHGWSGRHSGPPPGALNGPVSSTPAGSGRAPSPAASPGGSPTASPTGGSPVGPNAAKGGPLLSSQGYASYSFLVWPGTPSSAARTAMTGLSISVQRTGAGLSVKAGVSGQAPGSAHSYPGGARVYVVEASMGDEAGNSDYNLGDDGVVVTDAQGRIVQ